jgi:hypothetical protein
MITPEEYIKDKLQDLGKAVDDQIPVNYGFILLVFPFGPDGIMQYVSNCRRLDALQSMREFIARNEEADYGTDIGEKGTEGFEAWFEQELIRNAPQGKVTAEALKNLMGWCYDAYMAGRAHDARPEA